MAKKKKVILKHEPYQKFIGFMAENSIRQRHVSELLRLSRPTVSQKINGRLEFSFTEIEIMCDEWGLDANIFRTRKLRKSNKIQSEQGVSNCSGT